MKSKLLLSGFVVVLILTGSFINKQSDGNDKKEKIKKKSYQIRQEQIKSGVYSYFKGGTLYVFDTNKRFIRKIKLYDTDTNTYTYRSKHDEIKDANVWDTLIYLSQEQEGKYLFVSLGYANSPECIYFALIDLKSKKLILNQKSNVLTDSSYVWGETFLDFMSFPKISKDDKYFLFTNGMGVELIGFVIYDNNNKLVKNGAFYNFSPYEDDGNLKWLDNNTFYYWDRMDSVPKNLPKPERDYDYYIHKIYWINGRDSVTNEIKIGIGQ